MKEDSILSKIFGSGRASAEGLEFLARSEMVQTLLKDYDAALVTRRALLLDDLKKLPEKHASRAKAAKLAGAASERLEKAREELRAAIEAYSQASGRAAGLDFAFHSEEARLTQELEATADPRLDRFLAGCSRLFDRCREHALFGPDSGVALEATLAAMERARALKLKALPADEVTVQLVTIASDLDAEVRRLGYGVPDVETGELPKGHLLPEREPKKASIEKPDARFGAAQ